MSIKHTQGNLSSNTLIPDRDKPFLLYRLTLQSSKFSFDFASFFVYSGPGDKNENSLLSHLKGPCIGVAVHSEGNIRGFYDTVTCQLHYINDMQFTTVIRWRKLIPIGLIKIEQNLKVVILKEMNNSWLQWCLQL